MIFIYFLLWYSLFILLKSENSNQITNLLLKDLKQYIKFWIITLNYKLSYNRKIRNASNIWLRGSLEIIDSKLYLKLILFKFI